MQSDSQTLRAKRSSRGNPGRSGCGVTGRLDRRSRGARRCWPALAAICLLLSLGVTARAQSPGPTEYEIKAACLYNFAKLIDWPEEAFDSTKMPFSIGILGEDPFGANLERVIRGKTIGGREISIRRSSGHTSCQLLFISASESENIARVLETIKGLSVVTVSELDGFAEQGGAIEFVIEENTVQFAINVDAADRAGVKMHPELLRLSTVVTDDEAAEKAPPPLD